MKELEGKRIKLRKWNKSDLVDLYEYACLPDIGPKAGWTPHKNIDESSKIIDLFISNNDVYAIELKKNKKVIGSIGFHNRIINSTLKDLKQREIAIVLNPKYWSRGYAHESIELLIQYGFNELNLDIIWMCHQLDNNRSKKMIQKCGFDFLFKKDIVLERLNKKVKMQYYILKRDVIEMNSKMFTRKKRYDKITLIER